jgi:hypothetical protein
MLELIELDFPLLISVLLFVAGVTLVIVVRS